MCRLPTVFSDSLTSLTFLLVLFAQLVTVSSSLIYCSSQNTGSNSNELNYQYQSNGWCHDQCVDNYAFAVVQDQSCWCSNYIPAQQQSTGDCNEDCPGFPDDKCGKKGSLFGYVALTKKPSGTQGASQPSATVSTPSASIPPVSSSPPPLDTSGPTSNPPSSAAPPPPPTTMITTPSAAASSTTFSPTPVTEVKTMTVSGVVVTQTVTGMSTAAPALSQPEQKKNNTGSIVGGVVGGFGGLALVGALGFILLRRRQRNTQGDDGNTSGIQRNTSTMSKAGLLRPSEKIAPHVNTSINRNSRHIDTDSISPASGSERRNSRPFIFDQRLNPSAIMDLDNGSRSSLVTMDDNRDYTRTLNIRNPDPDPR